MPLGYSVLFLQGGASTQFLMIPMNFLKNQAGAAYLDTSYFALKAIHEAQHFGKVQIIGSSKESSYLHCTSNNAIEVTQ